MLVRKIGIVSGLSLLIVVHSNVVHLPILFHLSY